MKIVVFQAQPQYAGTVIAGTLFNHIQRGDEVTVVSISDGERLTELEPEEKVAQINREEMQAAAQVLGIKDLRFLGHPDVEAQNTLALRLELNNILREVRPGVMITHWPNDTFPDFREVGQAAVDACFYSVLHTGKWAEKGPPFLTGRAYGFHYPGLSVGFEATDIIDISDVLDTKIKAIDCFKLHIRASHKGNLEEYHSFNLSPNRAWAFESGFWMGVQFAEPFAMLKIQEVHNRAKKYLAS